MYKLKDQNLDFFPTVIALCLLYLQPYNLFRKQIYAYHTHDPSQLLDLLNFKASSGV